MKFRKNFIASAGNRTRVTRLEDQAANHYAILTWLEKSVNLGLFICHKHIIFAQGGGQGAFTNDVQAKSHP